MQRVALVEEVGCLAFGRSYNMQVYVQVQLRLLKVIRWWGRWWCEHERERKRERVC